MDTYRALVRGLLGIGILILGCDSVMKCKNDGGDNVNWYILYKLPSSVSGGLSYMYMDESTNGWIMSSKQIDSTSGALARTLTPLFDFHVLKPENEGYILYSDKPPNVKSVADSYGHSKGVVMLDKETGIWLSHSTPNFPYRSNDVYRSTDFWPSSGSQNAQMFLCVTYPYNEFRKIGLQLQYIHPYVFDYHLPNTFLSELKCVTEKGCYPKQAPWAHATQLTSEQGRQFISIAKYHRFGDDLYSGLVAYSLQQQLYVKSWGKMRNPLPSNCTIPYHVYNVLEVRLPGQRPFTHMTDHAKWCVTVDSDWVCVADTNREVKQMSRGGGAICMRNATVGGAFFRMVALYEQCEEEHDRARARAHKRDL